MSDSRVSTCLWFDQNAEEAVRFYVATLPNAGITGLVRYGKNAPLPEGLALVVNFEIDGQRFMALNGGTHFKLTEAVSISVECETQSEIDDLWERLSAGGEKSQCGWLKDQFGLSWQIVPRALKRMIQSGTPEQIASMFAVMFPMQKLDIAALEKAFGTPASPGTTSTNT